MKKELREILQLRDKFTILGEKKIGDSSTINVLVPWGQADIKTTNGRIYPKALLQREVDRIQKAVESGSFIGTGDHPKSGLSDIATASHLVKKIWLDEGGRGWAQIKILDTQRGKNIQSLIKGGGRLGISTRGFGQVGKGGRVDNDYKLMGIDVVMNPSVSSATFSKANIFESVGFEGEEKVKKGGKGIKIDEKTVELALKLGYDALVNEFGYDKGWEQFKKENLMLTTAEWLLQNYENKFKNIREALDYLGSGELADGYIKRVEEEERITHYEPTPQLCEEAFLLGITVQEYVEKLNKVAGHTGKADVPVDEAQQAGLPGSTKLVEKMLEYPDGVKRIVYVSEKVDVHEVLERVRKAPPPLTEKQELEKEAQRIFRIEKATNPGTVESIQSIKEMLIAEKQRVQEEKKQTKANALSERIKESIASKGATLLKEYEE